MSQAGAEISLQAQADGVEVGQADLFAGTVVADERRTMPVLRRGRSFEGRCCQTAQSVSERSGPTSASPKAGT